MWFSATALFLATSTRHCGGQNVVDSSGGAILTFITLKKILMTFGQYPTEGGAHTSLKAT